MVAADAKISIGGKFWFYLLPSVVGWHMSPSRLLDLGVTKEG